MSEQQPRSDEEDVPRRGGDDADRFAGEKDADLRSRDVTEGAERAPHRSMFRAMGFDDEDLSSPIVGVPNPAADITPCNVHLDDVADAAIDGIDGAGGMPIEFGPEVLAGSETGRWPTRSDLRLPEAQRELVRRVHETGTPVVGVLVTGRPLIVDWMAEHVPALLMAYFPGTEGGVAVAETLFGDNDPSGRLPISVPRDEGDLPQHHDALSHPTPIGEDEHPDSYDPLYPFGHGLSYTTFETTDLSATVEPTAAEGDGETDSAEQTVRIAVEVSNVGDRSGTETVQVYARQRHASRVRPVRSLVGFERVTLDPGESERVEVDIPVEHLGFYKPREGHVVELGAYRFDVDGASTTLEL